jgi:hypothetical protein
MNDLHLPISSFFSIKRLLSPYGVFYMVAVEENKPSEIIDFMSKEGFQGCVVGSMRARNELLCVLRFDRRMMCKFV